MDNAPPKPRRRNRRRGRRRPNRSRGPASTAALAGLPLAIRSRSTAVSRVFVNLADYKFVNNPAPQILMLTATLFDILGGLNDYVNQFWDEFIVERVAVHLYDVTTATTEVRLYTSRENNFTSSGSLATFGRTFGARLYAYSATRGIATGNGRLPLLLTVRRPVFDLTGSQNDFASKWLPVANNQKTQFVFGAIAAVAADNADKEALGVRLQMTYYLSFRGIQ